MYLLDSDILSILNLRSGELFATVFSRFEDVNDEDVFVSIVSFHEQMQGWQTYLNRSRTQDGVIRAYGGLEKLLTNFAESQVLPFDEAAAEVFDELKSKKIRIGTMDLRIASIVICNGMVLVTRNTVDFERVPNLSFEDWTTRDPK